MLFMKLREFYGKPAVKIPAGAATGLGMLGAAIYALTTNNIDAQVIVPILVFYGEITYSVPTIKDGISDIRDSKRGRKYWDDACY